MYTQCPECLTVFEIDEDVLQTSLGIVRCGHCTERFDALRSLSDTLPLDPWASLAESGTRPRVPTLTTAVPSGAGGSAVQPEQQPRPIEASLATPESATMETPPDEPASAADNADWLAEIEQAERADSLIADAAGIPREPAADDARSGLEAPFQPHFVELDTAPPAIDDRNAFASWWGNGIGPETAEHASSDTAYPPDQDTATVTNETPGPGAEIVDSEADQGVIDPTESAPQALDHEDQPAPSDGNADEPTIPSVPEPIPAAMGMDDEDGLTEASAKTASDDPLLPATLYVRPRQPRLTRTRVLWALGCLILAVILAAQLAWIKRVALFGNPQTRQWVVLACETLPCHLPPMHDIAKLQLVARDIRPDPQRPGALMITATLHNSAHVRQAWPIVVVKLSDIDNNPVAMRRFRPRKYMPDPTRRAAGIAPGATAAVAFEVADPGKRAISFQFSFE